MFRNRGQPAIGNCRCRIESFLVLGALLLQALQTRKVPGQDLEGDDAKSVDIPLESESIGEVSVSQLFRADIKHEITRFEILQPPHQGLPKVSNEDILKPSRVPGHENARGSKASVKHTFVVRVGKAPGKITNHFNGLITLKETPQSLHRSDLPALILALPSEKRSRNCRQ